MRDAIAVIGLGMLLAGCHIRQANDSNNADANIAAPQPDATTVNITEPDALNAKSAAMVRSSDSVSSAADAQDAANLVSRYYALIGNGEYGDAWALWDRDGAASGASEAQFAARFSRYANYAAKVGAPGPVDTGAGQQYVTVPVHISGKAKEGGAPISKVGLVTLHRTGAVSGATDAQSAWRISKIDLGDLPMGAPKVAPTAAGGVSARVITARFKCVDGTILTTIFDNPKSIVTVRRGGKEIAVMAQQRAADGMFYRTGDFVLRGKGRQISFSTPSGAPLACTQIGG